MYLPYTFQDYKPSPITSFPVASLIFVVVVGWSSAGARICTVVVPELDEELEEELDELIVAAAAASTASSASLFLAWAAVSNHINYNIVIIINSEHNHQKSKPLILK